MQALADCLESIRLGADADAALQQHPEYRAQLKTLLEVASLIHPLAEDVAPSRAWRESVRTRLFELREGPAPSAFDT